MTDYAQDLTLERRLKAKDKLIAELLACLQNLLDRGLINDLGDHIDEVHEVIRKAKA